MDEQDLGKILIYQNEKGVTNFPYTMGRKWVQRHAGLILPTLYGKPITG